MPVTHCPMWHCMHAMHPPAMMAEVPNATASAPRHSALTASTPSRIPPISTSSMSWRRPISSSASIASMMAGSVGTPT